MSKERSLEQLDAKIQRDFDIGCAVVLACAAIGLVLVWAGHPGAINMAVGCAIGAALMAVISRVIIRVTR